MAWFLSSPLLPELGTCVGKLQQQLMAAEVSPSAGAALGNSKSGQSGQAVNDGKGEKENDWKR